jgi:hypothetical protein
MLTKYAYHCVCNVATQPPWHAVSIIIQSYTVPAPLVVTQTASNAPTPHTSAPRRPRRFGRRPQRWPARSHRPAHGWHAPASARTTGSSCASAAAAPAPCWQSSGAHPAPARTPQQRPGTSSCALRCTSGHVPRMLMNSISNYIPNVSALSCSTVAPHAVIGAVHDMIIAAASYTSVQTSKLSTAHAIFV